MSKAKIILGLGLWTAIMPFLGFPGTWKDFFLLATGLVITLLAFFIRREEEMSLQASEKGEKVTHSYVENKETMNSSHS